VSNNKQTSPPLQTEKQLKQTIVLPEASQKIHKQVLADKVNSDFIKEISNQQNTTELPTNPASSAKHKRVPKPNPDINLTKQASKQSEQADHNICLTMECNLKTNYKKLTHRPFSRPPKFLN